MKTIIKIYKTIDNLRKDDFIILEPTKEELKDILNKVKSNKDMKKTIIKVLGKYNNFDIDNKSLKDLEKTLIKDNFTLTEIAYKNFDFDGSEAHKEYRRDNNKIKIFYNNENILLIEHEFKDYKF